MTRGIPILFLMLALSIPALAQDATPLRLAVDPVASPVVARPALRDPFPAATDPLPRWVRLSVEKTIDQYQKTCGTQRSDPTIAIMAASPSAPRGWTCGTR
jgi:hypothetical protein